MLDWVNNVTFDYDIGFIMGDSASAADWKANVRGNYFIRLSGGEKSHALEKARTTPEGKPNFTLHVGDNLFDKNGNSILDGKNDGYAIASGNYSNSIAPITADGGVPVQLDSPLLTYKKIASQVGALRLNAAFAKPIHDELDTILMNNLLALKRHHVRHQNETGASEDGFGKLESTPAPVDSDRDGMPDFWEQATGSDWKLANHNDPAPANAFLSSGYTRLEEYLHFLATPHGYMTSAKPDAPSVLEVDLYRYTAGFTNVGLANYSAHSTVNGKASIMDKHLARFEPPAGFTGRASFYFRIADGDSHVWDQPFLVLVTNAATSGLTR